jgi:hypothetical protein
VTREELKRHFADGKARREWHNAYVASLPPYEKGMTVRCPTRNADGSPIAEDDTRGCGSENVTWDGMEMYDCHDCGIFFAPYAADPIHQRNRDPHKDLDNPGDPQ